MTPMTVTNHNFNAEVAECSQLVLVDFWASWCGPCKMIAPIVDELCQTRSDVKVCKINIDEEPELAIRFGVMSIPTLIVFKDGEVANKSVGLISKEDILALL